MIFFWFILGFQCHPHIESYDSEQSDSEQSGADTNSESSETYEDLEESNNENESDSTCSVASDGNDFWTPKCDDKQKPQTNQYFSTLDDTFKFYKRYGRVCKFDV